MCNTAYLEQTDQEELLNTNGFVGRPWGQEGKMFSLGRKNLNLFAGHSLYSTDPADLLEREDVKELIDEKHHHFFMVDDDIDHDPEYELAYEQWLEERVAVVGTRPTNNDAFIEMAFGEVPAIPHDDFDEKLPTCLKVGMAPDRNGVDEPRRWTRVESQGHKYPYKNRKGRPTIRRAVELEP